MEYLMPWFHPEFCKALSKKININTWRFKGVYPFDQKVVFDIMDAKKYSKVSTAKTKLSTKIDLTLLQTLMYTDIPSLSPRKS